MDTWADCDTLIGVACSALGWGHNSATWIPLMLLWYVFSMECDLVMIILCSLHVVSQLCVCVCVCVCAHCSMLLLATTSSSSLALTWYKLAHNPSCTHTHTYAHTHRVESPLFYDRLLSCKSLLRWVVLSLQSTPVSDWPIRSSHVSGLMMTSRQMLQLLWLRWVG